VTAPTVAPMWCVTCKRFSGQCFDRMEHALSWEPANGRGRRGHGWWVMLGVWVLGAPLIIATLVLLALAILV
jgi:hypothetical protein